ncbi:MAG: ATPase [Alphaproteobacteria bacterium]|nr:ATPase [Alphaproteobacteria bacterium]
MRGYYVPGLVFAACTISSLLSAIWVLILALSQPVLGVTLQAQDNHLAIAGIAAESDLPSAVIGQRLLGIAQEGEPVIAVDARTLIEEPDMIGNADWLRDFYVQQDRLFQALSSGLVSVTVQNGAVPTSLTARVRGGRPMSDLPVKFWTQLGVGCVGLIIGFWLVCLRTRDLAAWMVLLTGVGLAMASGAAGLYSTRELALGYSVFRTASQVNSSGTLLFGIGILTLFLIYPRRIVPRIVLPLPALIIGSTMLFIQMADWPRHVGLLQDGVAIIMLLLLGAIACQLVVNRRDPAARAMLGWLGLSVTLGAGGFVVTAILPTLMGRDVLVQQSTAFLFFLLIYAGIALGVARYRLFDLPDWSARVMFYGVGVALLLLLDAALIYGLSVDRAPAFAISLALIGSFYLPLRRRVADWVQRKGTLSADDIYRRIIEIPHAIAPQQKEAALIKFWDDLFTPLSITPLDRGGTVETALHDNGAALTIAPVFGLPPLRLAWAKHGTRLFSSKDLARAETINGFIQTSLQQNQIYVDAIETERARINRDMHDNIGVLLVSALHDSRSDRKNDLIRQTLTDLREIIANPDQNKRALASVIADLRAEASIHLEVADIAVEWRYGGLPEIDIDPQIVQTLRALFREGTNNVVRHSGAGKVVCDILYAAPDLSVTLRDDGVGISPASPSNGNGIGNLANRVAHLGGLFDLKSDGSGTVLSARFPVRPPCTGPA